MPHIFTSDQTFAVFLAEPVADLLAIIYTVVIFALRFPKALREMKVV